MYFKLGLSGTDIIASSGITTAAPAMDKLLYFNRFGMIGRYISGPVSIYIKVIKTEIPRIISVQYKNILPRFRIMIFFLQSPAFPDFIYSSSF